MTENTEVQPEEDTDFALTNESPEEWSKTEFMELDSMNHNQSLCDVVLYVDWEDRTAHVGTHMQNTGTPMSVWNGMASEFDIPEDTDFSRFLKQFNEEIRPILKQLGDAFDPYWNGSDWKGDFVMDQGKYRELTDNIVELLSGFFTHDMCWYTSLIDLYGGDRNQLLFDLKSDGIDLLTANLDDKEVMKKAVEAVTYGDGSDYILLGVDAKDELRGLQKDVRYDAEVE